MSMADWFDKKLDETYERGRADERRNTEDERKKAEDERKKSLFSKISSVRSLMDKMGWSADEAMSMMGLSDEDKQEIRPLVQGNV